MQLVVSPFRPLEKPQDLDYAILPDGTGHHKIHRVLCLAHRCLSGDFCSNAVTCINAFEKIVSKDMFQKKMEAVSMVLMAQMTEFMEQYIILKDFRKTDYVQIQIYVRACGTAAPVRSIMLYCHTVV